MIKFLLIYFSLVLLNIYVFHAVIGFSSSNIKPYQILPIWLFFFINIYVYYRFARHISGR